MEVAALIDGQHQWPQFRVFQTSPAEFKTVKDAEIHFVFGQELTEVNAVAAGNQLSRESGLRFHESAEGLHHRPDKRFGGIPEEGAGHADAYGAGRNAFIFASWTTRVYGQPGKKRREYKAYMGLPFHAKNPQLIADHKPP